MSVFLGDLKQLSCGQLMEKLSELVSEYNNRSTLAGGDYQLDLKKTEILDEIERKCGKKCRVNLVAGTTSLYEIKCD
ncbi:hypothetical protein NYR97_16775 [Xanthomonas hydrangeae]|uniref:Uncharacterized protein n=1 Tax=Xanthomonas hydrangeae TaxID=2775159 RepID=A0AAU0BAE2_9XANT|nr:hypothetical protein [Xanthomonas hydrangeae]WOB48872.1 hypothetical protein NYR97_16775 [Xanthomonas hydrangeae]